MKQCHAGLKPKCEQLVHIVMGITSPKCVPIQDSLTNKSEQYLK
jgi:hypothetical protein